MTTKFDYVIVGGGTSGLVVVERLTEDPNTSVLVLEAGTEHTTDPRIRTPAFWRPLLGLEDFDWNYQSVPQVSWCGFPDLPPQGPLISEWLDTNQAVEIPGWKGHRPSTGQAHRRVKRHQRPSFRGQL
jgi:choline dehydrogenase-like flavoprotein